MTQQPLLAGRYQRGDRLGQGGMGQVWRGFDSVLHREVAIKTVDLSEAEDVATRDRFQREAFATASLSHANVVTVFDAGIDGSIAYLVMELLPGPTLSAVVAARGPLPVDEAIEYARQTAAALQAAHQVGVVHRDIKPGNLMLDSAGQLKVVDFGIARLAQTSAARLTATDTTLGSAAYMAPEQARGDRATEATDVYALGCVLMTLLTGRPPFEADHPMAVLHQQLNVPAPRVRERRPEVPAGLDDLVAEMLAKDAVQRPSDAAAVLSALAGLRVEGPGETAVLTSAAPPTVLLGDAPTRVDEPASTRRGRGRRAGWIAVGALLAVAALGWLVATLLDDRDPAAEGVGDQPRQSAPPADQSAPSTQDSNSGPGSGDEPPTTDQEALASAVADVRSAVESAVAEGPGGHEADKLLQGVDKLDEAAASGDTERLARDLDGFEKSLEHAVDKGEITESGQERIASAVSALRALVS